MQCNTALDASMHPHEPCLPWLLAVQVLPVLLVDYVVACECAPVLLMTPQGTHWLASWCRCWTLCSSPPVLYCPLDILYYTTAVLYYTALLHRPWTEATFKRVVRPSQQAPRSNRSRRAPHPRRLRQQTRQQGWQQQGFRRRGQQSGRWQASSV